MSHNDPTNSLNGGSLNGGSLNGGSMNGGDRPHGRGLRPAVPSACRAALRNVDASQQHIAECAFCTARLKAAQSVGRFASERPQMPAALASSSALESIYERVAESPQQASIGEWLEQSPTPAIAEEGNGAHAGRWEDTTVAVDSASEEILGELVRGPQLPRAGVWSDVRRSILADVAHDEVASPRLRLTNWRILLAGAAASAVIGLLAVSDPAPSPPTIVFADLDRAPDVPFATIRYGSRR